MPRRTLIILASMIFILGAIVGYLGYYFYDIPKTKFLTEQRKEYLDKAADYEEKAIQLVKDSDDIWKLALSFKIIPDNAQEFTRQKTALASEYRQQALKYRELAAK